MTNQYFNSGLAIVQRGSHPGKGLSSRGGRVQPHAFSSLCYNRTCKGDPGCVVASSMTHSDAPCLTKDHLRDTSMFPNGPYPLDPRWQRLWPDAGRLPSAPSSRDGTKTPATGRETFLRRRRNGRTRSLFSRVAGGSELPEWASQRRTDPDRPPAPEGPWPHSSNCPAAAARRGFGLPVRKLTSQVASGEVTGAADGRPRAPARRLVATKLAATSRRVSHKPSFVRQRASE